MRDRFHQAVWRKSTYSNGDGDCLEVADGVAGVVPVRDSKDPHGPVLGFAPEAWWSFVAGVQAGDFPAGS
ncbi:DUF397 domain-containing protein [Kitasatospora xanthocidica]|uniref:DUF397 domain-containing protein n=1 Tax=Kitasatospora xanthocidica TaxID=83382 RepID=A0A372ZM20_9ACTN|nr:DUF397 domain-containing protein [Kitasatospora xanthocidica]RGD56614.1 DUF397 domain-containing protein [Kitasatospora xanthocidica]